MEHMLPEISVLLTAIAQFRSRQIDLENLQATLWNCAQGLTAHEDRLLREKLQDAEGKLELIRFTIDSENVYNEALKALGEVELYLIGTVPKDHDKRD